MAESTPPPDGRYSPRSGRFASGRSGVRTSWAPPTSKPRPGAIFPAWVLIVVRPSRSYAPITVRWFLHTVKEVRGRSGRQRTTVAGLGDEEPVTPILDHAAVLTPALPSIEVLGPVIAFEHPQSGLGIAGSGQTADDRLPPSAPCRPLCPRPRAACRSTRSCLRPSGRHRRHRWDGNASSPRPCRLPLGHRGRGQRTRLRGVRRSRSRRHAAGPAAGYPPPRWHPPTRSAAASRVTCRIVLMKY